MKYRVEIEGCYYEERHDLKLLAHLNDMYFALSEGLNEIRNRLKHGDDVSQSEERFLENLRETMWVEGIEL